MSNLAVTTSRTIRFGCVTITLWSKAAPRVTRADRRDAEAALRNVRNEAEFWEGTQRAYPQDVPMLAAYRTGGTVWEAYAAEWVRTRALAYAARRAA
jgi:hypothetical protein